MGTCNEGNVGSVPDKFDRLMEPLFTEYFARPENGDLLLSLINALLSTDTGLSRLPLAPGVERPKTKFKRITVIDVSSTRSLDDGKGTRFELSGTAEDDSEVYIDLQTCKPSYIENRAEICSSLMMSKYNLIRTIDKGIVRPTISIWLLEGSLSRRIKSEKVIRANVVIDRDTCEIASDLKTVYFVQMQKDKQHEYHDLRLRGILTLEAEAWLRFLLSDGSADGWKAMDEMSPEIAQKLRQIESKFWGDDLNRYVYNLAEDNEIQWQQNYKYAYRKGFSNGKKQGIMQGDEEGAERITFEVVQRMIGKELPDDFILEMANITPKQLQEYKNEYKLDHPEA